MKTSGPCKGRHFEGQRLVRVNRLRNRITRAAKALETDETMQWLVEFVARIGKGQPAGRGPLVRKPGGAFPAGDVQRPSCQAAKVAWRRSSKRAEARGLGRQLERAKAAQESDLPLGAKARGGDSATQRGKGIVGASLAWVRLSRARPRLAPRSGRQRSPERRSAARDKVSRVIGRTPRAGSSPPSRRCSRS